MTVRFYFDHHVHRSIVTGLRHRGVDCLTAEEDGRRGDPDETLLARATELGRVLVSNDSDFQVIAGEWWAAGRTFADIFRVPLDAMTVGAVIENLYIVASASEAEEWVDRVEYLPL